MKKSILVLIAGVLFFCCPGCGQKNNNYEAAIRASRDSMNSFLSRSGVPGAAITILVDGNVVWSEGFGYADLEQKVRVDPAKTKFRVASISKSLTATGLALLYEQGKIQLDSSVYFYLPDFPKKKYRPTIRQLAGHMGGIRWYQGDEFLSARKYNTVKEGLGIFENDSLMFEPGTKYQYSSFGFNLLSAVLEKAAKKNFLNFMREQVFKPLHLNNTVPDLNDSVIGDRGRFYELHNARLANAPYVDNSCKWGGGGFLSTSEDLVKFGDQYLRPGFLKKETIELFTTSQKLRDGTSNHYGMGWGTGTDRKGRKWFGHAGGAVGGTSDLVIFPGEKIVVVMLTNLSGAHIDGLPATLAGLFMH